MTQPPPQPQSQPGSCTAVETLSPSPVWGLCLSCSAWWPVGSLYDLQSGVSLPALTRPWHRVARSLQKLWELCRCPAKFPLIAVARPLSPPLLPIRKTGSLPPHSCAVVRAWICVCVQHVICERRSRTGIDHSPIKTLKEAQNSCCHLPAPPAYCV